MQNMDVFKTLRPKIDTFEKKKEKKENRGKKVRL